MLLFSLNLNMTGFKSFSSKKDVSRDFMFPNGVSPEVGCCLVPVCMLPCSFARPDLPIRLPDDPVLSFRPSSVFLTPLPTQFSHRERAAASFVHPAPNPMNNQFRLFRKTLRQQPEPARSVVKSSNQNRLSAISSISLEKVIDQA